MEDIRPKIDSRHLRELVENQEEKIVADVYDEDGEIFDHTYNWESAQNYAATGLKVVALCGDGHMSKEECQRLYDYEKRIYEDCFDLDNYPDAA